MAFSDMVAAAAEAERQRRRRAREALSQAAENTESPRTKLAEETTQDDHRPATILPEAVPLVPVSRAETELSRATNTCRKDRQPNLLTRTARQDDNTLKEPDECITTKNIGHSRQLYKGDGASGKVRESGLQVPSPKVAARKGNALPKSTIVTDTGLKKDARQETGLVKAPQQDKSTKGTTQDATRPKTIETKAAPLTALSRKLAWSSQAINQDSKAQREDLLCRTSTQIGDDLQESDESTPTKKKGAPQSAANKPNTEQGQTKPQPENNSPRPTALTALSLNGLIPKKRKRPSRETSPTLFVDATPSEVAIKQPSLSQDAAVASPKVKEDPEATNGDTTEASTDTTSKDAEDAANASSSSTARPRTKRQRVYKSKEVVDMRMKAAEWYLNINTKEKFPRGDKATLDHAKQLITNCIDATKNNGDSKKCFSELRSKIHEMELYKFVTPILVKKSKVLEPEGLLQVFDGPDKNIFPWDIAADAEALWLRWMSGDLDGFLLRGIVTTKTVNEEGSKKTAYSIQKEWKKKSANVSGPNGLINGQWWPSRICALRDGAHGAIEGGISGQADKGAFSIVVSKGSDYADQDHGETLEYCGTECRKPPIAPTADTKLLDKAYLLKQPVRVLRAAKKGSKYAPREGVRYDGMYEIVDKEILDPATAMSRFSLRRLPGQDPIRWRGVGARPTDQELVERMSIRKELE